ncbi:MAG: glycosyltransferase family 4 protein [Leptolyngbyaceae cyanobacterium SL_1_1]|nr:glycosyltransferase family 4 protein [Leptolyngbyaceae cyanobacterium RM1_1_2]NJO10381.1 glycosyltransferase family 4 protein [Leptolyngbyaceae cyanobacterium SL_1_1]
MRILYDGLVYAVQPAGGINRYFKNLIAHLPDNIQPTLTLCKPLSVDYPAHTNLKIKTNSQLESLPDRLSLLLARLYFRNTIDFTNFNVIHPTYYCLFSRQKLKEIKIPIVLTVWDMIHEIFSEEIDPKGYHIQMKQQAILAADAILCISENTKKDLMERYPISEDRIRVTYLASEIDIHMSYGNEIVPCQSYFLYVGKRSGYKNFDCLLEAFAKSVSVKSNLSLCVVGSPFSKAEKEKISALKLWSYIEHYGYVNDLHLAKLYRCSRGLVYPSRYEGFGIPPLEAMACGTVVVAANCSSLPEVVGNSGILFNPNSASDLADIMLSLVSNSTKRTSLIESACRRAKLFSWEKTTAQTAKSYQQIC